MSIIQVRFEQLRTELELSGGQWLEEFARFEQQARQSLKGLRESLGASQEPRKEQSLVLTNSFNQQANGVAESFKSAELKAEEEMAEYSGMLAELERNVATEIKQENSEREAQQDVFLGLLESTCDTIQGVIA